jgi:hypothetical protein
VEWGADADEDIEELEMVPEAQAEPVARAPPPRPARQGGMMKAAVAVGVVIALVAVSLAAFVLTQPAPEKEKPKPPVIPTDTLSDADVFISEVRPSDALYLQGTSVELRVGPGVTDLKDWRLTTFDNDSYVFPPTPVSGDPAYIMVELSAGRKTGAELSLDPADELGLYAPDGKLSDFVRWAGGGSDRDPSRGGWAAGSTGVYLDAGMTVSRLDFARCNASAWNASPASPGRPNILEVAPAGARQVLWMRSGRDFPSVLGNGPSPVRLSPGRPVERALLQEAAAHLDFALKQVRRLGDPFSAQNSTSGAPVLEFWVTNRSAYAGITAPDGRVSLDLGANRHLNSFVCARELTELVELARLGAPSDQGQFLREGLAISEGLRAASMEISPGTPSVDSLWLEMKNAGLFNPYEHGRNLTVPFVQPWDYDAHHLANAWLFFEYNDRRFVESGLGPSLAQSLMLARKDLLVALPELTGRNLTALFHGWLDWRTASGYRYAQPLLQASDGLGQQGLSGTAAIPAWTAWVGRFGVNVSGSAEFNLSAGAPGGAVYFKLVSSRTGAALVNGPVPAGAARAVMAGGLRPLDEILLVAGAAEAPGTMSYRAAALPPGPADLTPPDGSYTTDPRPVLGWSEVPGTDRYQVQVASNPDFIDPGIDQSVSALTWQPAAALPDGPHYWRVRGWTPLGNPTAWSDGAELTVDTEAPFAYPEIDEPKYRAGPSAAWNVTRNTQISFRLNSSAGSPETVYYKFPGSPDWSVYGGTFQAPGPDGPLSLAYYSRDAAGNLQPEQTLELNVDDTAPSINVSVGSPNHAASPGDIVNVSRKTLITLLFSDTGSGVADATYRMGGQTLPYTAPFNLTGPGGLVLVQMTARDNLGSQNTQNLRLYLDDMAPDVTVIGLANGTLQRGTHRVTLAVNDPSGAATASYLVDSHEEWSSNAAPFAWDWNTASVADGDHQVEVRVADNLGNQASVFIGVKTDNTAPSTTLTFDAPRYRLSASDLWNVSSATKFNLTAVEPPTASGVAATWYTVDSVYHEGIQFTLDKSLGSGRHDITWGSRDRSGNNETAQSIAVVLDYTSPSPSLTSPQPAAQVSGIVDVAASESSGATDVAYCTFSYSLDGMNWFDIWTDQNSTANWNCQWNTTKVQNGNYWLRAVMADRVENASPAMIQVAVLN